MRHSVIYSKTFQVAILTSLLSIADTAMTAPVYPLKAGSTGRYLVDQTNTPFLITGDSAQALLGAISEADAETYFAHRAAAGVNFVWIHMICGASYSGCRADGTTFDGIAPFTTSGDISTPNPVYFSRLDNIVRAAAAHDINLLLSPIETINWLPLLRNNGTTRAFNYGVYVGNRYRNFPNIVWFHGNDFQTWSTASDDALVLAVANGIRSVDTNHIHTVELDFPTSASLNDSNWSSVIDLNLAYSYCSTYDQVQREYVAHPSKPVYFMEGMYEWQDYMSGYNGTTGPQKLRAQAYWTQLTGAAGNVYGNRYIFRMEPNLWKNHLNDSGFMQFGHWKSFFASHPWQNLVPDRAHTTVTAGYGTYEPISPCIQDNTSTYVATARSGDGNLIISYIPTAQTSAISVNMAQLSGTATGRWFDPTNGAYTTATGSPFTNSGSRQFAHPGRNSAGDNDWVLVLEVAGNSSASPCDLNGNGGTDVTDVQLCSNQAIQVTACAAGDINRDGACNVIDVQRVVNAALGGACVTQ